jgi:DNA topoisomerase-1
MYFVGLIAADGHNTGKEVKIYNGEGLRDVFHRCCTLFGLEVKNYGKHLSVASKLLCEILDKLCVFKGNKAGKLDFPNLILKQPDSLVLAFIAGFFDGDGSASITKGMPVISIGSRSKLFLKKLKLTLLTFGISSYLHSNSIRIYLDDARRFHKTVRKFVLVKKRELDSCTKMKNVRSSKTVLLPSKNIKLKLSEFGLSLQDVAAKVGRIRYTTRSGYDRCYLFTKKKLSKLSSILQDPLLGALGNGDVTWKKVKRIVRRKCNVPLYDLTTSCKNFIGNGVILHNCDPAHPSIYPTGEKPGKLAEQQKKLYDLIVRRFLSVFGKPALVEGMKVELDIGGQTFFIHGRKVLDEGWLNYYGPYGATGEVILPQLRKGQELEVKEVRLEEKQTQSPPRYNPASIVKEMERLGIGTKSTRAEIVQHLYERGYIYGSQITVTDLGLAVVDSLLKHCPEIASEELTAEFEREMEAIQEGKKTREEVIARARAELNKILDKFKQHQLEIGKQLAEAYRVTRMKQRVLGKCSKCGGDLRVIVSRATHKRFVGCSNYPKCTNTFPLPQAGTIISLGRACERCGAPMIQINRAGTRPYRMCIDPKCPSKADLGIKNSWPKNSN